MPKRNLKMIMTTLFAASHMLQANAADNLLELSLTELMEFEITVASGPENKLTKRESPGIVTVLTRQDIDATGASNLFELLRFVPGFDIGSDAYNLTGFIVRGYAAVEGKVLMNLNGMPINENTYGTLFSAANETLDHIQRIEIIRGPGSALYGGFAELAVINIITRDMQGKHELAVGTNRTNADTGYVTTSFSGGIDSNLIEGLDINYFASYGERDNTEGYYIAAGSDSVYENSEDMHEKDSVSLLVDGAFKDLYFDVLYSRARSDLPVSSYDFDLEDYRYRPDPARQSYNAFITRLGYRYHGMKNTVINTSVQYGQFESGQYNDTFVETYPDWFFDIPTERLNIEIQAHHKPTGLDMLSIDVGVGGYQDKAELSQRMVDYMAYWLSDTEEVAGSQKYDTHYVFLQGILDAGDYTFTAGARTDEHDAFDRVTVPRFALTYTNGPFHYKLLAARAFKAPTLNNIILQKGLYAPIAPERNENYEIELGYLFGEHTKVVFNIFDNTLTDVITYEWSNSTYLNGGEFNTRGAELMTRVSGPWGFVALNISRHWLHDVDVLTSQDYFRYYTPESDYNESNDKLLGSAETQVALYGEYKINDQLSLDASMIYFGDRYSIDYREDLGYAYYAEVESDVLTNIFLRATDVYTKRLDLAVGVYNLTNADNVITSLDYNNSIAHRPGLGRRLDLRMKYEF